MLSLEHLRLHTALFELAKLCWHDFRKTKDELRCLCIVHSGDESLQNFLRTSTSQCAKDDSKSKIVRQNLVRFLMKRTQFCRCMPFFRKLLRIRAVPIGEKIWAGNHRTFQMETAVADVHKNVGILDHG